MQKVTLGDVCEILDNQRVPITASERKSGSYPYYGANGLQDYVDGYIFDDDLVLLAEDGGNFGSKDKPIAYRVSGKCWVNNHAHVLKPKDNIDVNYLCYSLMFYNVDGLVNGATRQKLTQKDMRKISIPLPLIEEQKAIAEKLDKVSILIEKRKQQLSLLDTIVKSKFVEMFGDPIKNNHGWKLGKLSEVAELKIGPFGSLLHKEDYVVGGHALINPSHIIDGKIKIDEKFSLSDSKYDELSAYHLIRGDVILGRRGEMGRCAVVDEDGLFCGTGCMIIRPNGKVLSYFLQKVLSSSSMKQIIEDRAVGVTMANLNVRIVSNLPIPIYPMNKQREYIQIIQKTDKSKAKIKQSLAALELLKKSLMQKYFG